MLNYILAMIIGALIGSAATMAIITLIWPDPVIDDELWRLDGLEGEDKDEQTKI